MDPEALQVLSLLPLLEVALEPLLDVILISAGVMLFLRNPIWQWVRQAMGCPVDQPLGRCHPVLKWELRIAGALIILGASALLIGSLTDLPRAGIDQARGIHQVVEKSSKTTP